MSTVPSLSFCSNSLSPPSWLEPNTTTLALPASLALALLANSSADFANSEPGSPTWPNLISVWAVAACANSAQASNDSSLKGFMTFLLGLSDCTVPGARFLVGRCQVATATLADFPILAETSQA